MTEDPTRNLPAVQPDSLSAEVSIRAKLEDTGLEVAGRSRALSAADQLLGGLFGIPAIVLENFRAGLEQRGRIERAFKEVRAKKHLEAIEQGDLLEVAAAHSSAMLEVRSFTNRAKVWVETEEALLSIPLEPDEPQASNQAMDPDWINIFADHAARASTERLQQLWGRILAGEIRKPGAFSLVTLRIIAELDGEVATAFQGIVAKRHPQGWILPSENYSAEHLTWRMLEDAGLIQESSEVKGVAIKLFGKPDTDSLLTAKHFGLLITPQLGLWETSFEVINLTRAGREIAEILPNDEEALFRAVARKLPGCPRIKLVRVLKRTAEGVEHETIEVLKDT